MKKSKQLSGKFIGLSLLLVIGVGIAAAALYLKHQFQQTAQVVEGSDDSTTPTQPAQPSLTPDSTERPPAPTGYSWQECTGMKATFLKPDGWYFKEEMQSGTVACFITKEEIKGTTKDEFKTGLSINGVKNVERKTGMVPTAFAEHFFTVESQLITKRLQKPVSLGMGPIKGYGQLVEAQNPGDQVLRIYNVVLGNDQTGSAYIMWFETPASDWEKNYEIWKTMMNVFGLDDEF